MQLNLADGAYADPCIDINNQLCINWFPAISEVNGRGNRNAEQEKARVLKQTSGTDLLINCGGATIRSHTVVRNFTYIVVDSSVYKITINQAFLSATKELIGTIDTSSGYVDVDSNPTQIMWVDGSKGYIYNDVTETFSQITDEHFIAGTNVVFTGGYFIVNRPFTGVMASSALNNGLSWDALDFTTTAVDNDNLKALAVSHEEIWAIGERSVEIYFNEGNSPGFPFSLRTGLSLKTGTKSPFSVVELNNNLYWLDNRGFFVTAGNSDLVRDNNTGYQLKTISTIVMTEELKSYANLEDAIGTYYNDRGHLMLEWSFPTDKKTWTYDVTTEQWHQHNYYNTYSGEQEHSLIQYATEFNNLTVVSGVRDGNVYLLSSQYPDDNGNLIRRKRTSAFLYNREDLKEVTIFRFSLKLGLINIPANGDYSDPQIGLKYSKDGGHNWSSTLWRSAGKIGEYNKIITWNCLGTSYQWMFEITFSDPALLALIDCWANVEVAA